MWLDILASTSERSKGQSIHSQKAPFGKIKCVTHRSPQPSQQKPEIKMRLSRKELDEETYEVLENVIPVETLPVCKERDKEGIKDERRL